VAVLISIVLSALVSATLSIGISRSQFDRRMREMDKINTVYVHRMIDTVTRAVKKHLENHTNSKTTGDE